MPVHREPKGKEAAQAPESGDRRTYSLFQLLINRDLAFDLGSNAKDDVLRLMGGRYQLIERREGRIIAPKGFGSINELVQAADKSETVNRALDPRGIVGASATELPEPRPAAPPERNPGEPASAEGALELARDMNRTVVVTKTNPPASASIPIPGQREAAAKEAEKEERTIRKLRLLKVALKGISRETFGKKSDFKPHVGYYDRILDETMMKAGETMPREDFESNIALGVAIVETSKAPLYQLAARQLIAEIEMKQIKDERRFRNLVREGNATDMAGWSEADIQQAGGRFQLREGNHFKGFKTIQALLAEADKKTKERA